MPFQHFRVPCPVYDKQKETGRTGITGNERSGRKTPAGNQIHEEGLKRGDRGDFAAVQA